MCFTFSFLFHSTYDHLTEDIICFNFVFSLLSVSFSKNVHFMRPISLPALFGGTSQPSVTVSDSLMVTFDESMS